MNACDGTHQEAPFHPDTLKVRLFFFGSALRIVDCNTMLSILPARKHALKMYLHYIIQSMKPWANNASLLVSAARFIVIAPRRLTFQWNRSFVTDAVISLVALETFKLSHTRITPSKMQSAHLPTPIPAPNSHWLSGILP